MTYEHECAEHGRFEARRSIRDETPDKEAPCPACGTMCRKVFCFNASRQLHFPEHFRTTLPMTGLKDNQGRSGEVEDLRRDFNRWDSGASGLRDAPKPGKALTGRKVFAP